MRYDFKLIPEIARAAAIGVIVFAVMILVDFDLEEVLADWQTYATSFASGAVAAGAAAVLAVITTRRGGA